MPDTVDQQLMWCNRARMILAATSGKGQKAAQKFDTELNSVRVKLQRLIEIAGESTPVVQEFISKLSAIASEANGLRDAADPKFKGKSGQKVLRNEAKAITAQLETLGKQIDGSKPANEILEARQRFFDNSARARKRLKELGSQSMANATEVQELLTFIDTAEQSVRTEPVYQTPAECDKATRVIGEWLGRLTLKMENAAKGERVLDVAQSKAKPQVEEQSATAQRVLAEGLTTGQLTPEMQSALETKLAEIDRNGAAGLWTEALALCKTLPSAAQCKKAYLLTKATLTSNFGAELALCEKALNALTPLLEGTSMELERAKYNQLIAKGGADRMSTKEVAALRGQMLKLIEGWDAQTLAQSEEQKLLDTAIRDLQTRARHRENLVPLPQKAENGRQLELVTSLRDQRLFTAGRQAADTLGRQLTAQTPAVTDGKKWQALAAGAVQTAADLNGWSLNEGLAPQLRADAKRLATALGPDNVGRLTLVRDWAALLLAHEQALSFLGTAKKSAEKFTKFNPERQPLDDNMGLEWAKIDKAISDFESVANTAKVDPQPMLRSCRGELAALTADWKDWLDNTTRASKTKIKTVKAGVAALLLKIDALDDPDTLAAAGLGQAEDKGRQLFDAAQSKFGSTALRALLAVDTLKGEDLKKRLAALAGNEALDEEGKPWAKRIEGVAALAKEAVKITGESQGRLERKNAALVQSVASQKLRLKTLRESMKSKGLDLKKFAPMLDGLDTELANLELLTTTGNVTASDVNNRLLAQLDRRVQNLQLLTTNSSAFEDYTASLKRHDASIQALGKDGLGNVAAETLSSLKEQLATLKTEVYGMEPTAAGDAVRALAVAINDATQELAAVRDQQNLALIAANDCLKRVAAFAKLGFAEAYRKSLETRVSAARDRAKAATELPAALRDFEAIQTELTALEANPDAAYKRQQNVLAEQHATLKLKREWEARLSVVNGSVMSRLGTALKKGGDDSQKDEVKRMVAMAEKAVKDNKDYERGLRLLTQVEGRVAQIERNPEGTALGDRKALPKHVEGYAANVVKLRLALEGFVSKAAAKVKDPVRQAKLQDALHKQVDPLTMQLNPGLFAAPLKILVDKDQPDTARREAREQALARLRETLGFLTTHPTMVKLASNPIVPLQPDMRALDASLTRLEAHLRASVR